MRGLGGWLGSQAKEFISDLRQGLGDELGPAARPAPQAQTSAGGVAGQSAESGSTKSAASSAALREQLAASTAVEDEDVGWDDEDDEQSPAAMSSPAPAVVPATGPQAMCAAPEAVPACKAPEAVPATGADNATEHPAAQECAVAAMGNPPLEGLEVKAHDAGHENELKGHASRVDNEVSRLRARCVELEQAAQAAQSAQTANEAEISVLRARCAKLEAADSEREALQTECAGLRSEVAELRAALQAAQSGPPAGSPPAGKAPSSGTTGAVSGSDKLADKSDEDVAWDDEDFGTTGTG